ncbi:MAG TPA: hypothetical protein VNM67_16165 [Thermoanaerobaculia bacterium]|jgi:hypothetical protein|nr:hypothetical protein [Thermoanaerobaculia bacterium]
MRSLRPIAALLLLLACPLMASAAQDRPEPSYGSRYDIRYLSVHAAESLVWDLCPQKNACVVRGLANANGRGAVLEVNADHETHARIAKALAERDSAPPTQVFQLVLLAAGNKSNGPAPTLSEGAQKALDDMKKFLPFTHYRMLDTALLRVTQDDVAQAQIAGLLGTRYKVAMRFRAGGTDGKSLFIDGFGLDEMNDRDLIQTSFSMDVGETVVVGTSSVGAEQDSLVAILTALP